MAGKGVERLEYNLNKLKEQTFKDFEIVVSDDSENEDIKNLCSKWLNDLSIKYFKNAGPKGPSPNLNNAIKNSSGELIRVICQDDFFLDQDSIFKTINGFDQKTKWLTAAYVHTNNRINFINPHIPSLSAIPYSDNRIGTHSCLCFINEQKEFFDENLIYYMDCDFHYRMLKRYGIPKVLKEPTFAQLLSPEQVTNTLVTGDLAKKEYEYVTKKYNNEIYKSGGSIFERVTIL
jgi:glycosyltransferase involved in cell wall biosynthesis